MRAEDFNEHKPGRLVKTPQGYLAFAPNPLPPQLDFSWRLAQRMSDADRALSELAGLARMLPNPHLLIGPFIRREAVLSSRIEGTRASLSELFYFEAANEAPNDASDVKEVANYVKALDHGLSRLSELPLSLRLIREMHERLMEGVRGDHLIPGEFRDRQNWIGPPGSALMEATYVPPPIDEMQRALDEFEKYLHADSEFPLLIRLAIIHYQFEAIHPFFDGNGRIGRLLITLLLCAEGALPQPLLYLSAFFERYREDYYRALLAVSQRGEWTNWVGFFLRGVEEQSRDAIKKSSRLLDLWRQYRQRLQSARASTLALRLLDEMFEMPVTTYGGAAALLNVTQRTARLNVEKLVEIGILKEASGRRRNRIFAAMEIIDILEARETTD